MKISDVAQIIYSRFPLETQERWDNSGKQILFPADECSGVAVTLDLSVEAVSAACESGCNLLVSHHPLFFKEITSIDTETPEGRIAVAAIKNGVSIISVHTPADLRFCSQLAEDLTGFSFSDNDKEPFCALGEAAGMTLEALAGKISARKGIPLRIIGNPDMKISTVAFINGSGASFSRTIFENTIADCVITGDVSFHYAQNAIAMNKGIIDAGHFGTEIRIKDFIADDINDCLTEKGIRGLKVIVLQTDADPYKTRGNNAS